MTELTVKLLTEMDFHVHKICRICLEEGVLTSVFSGTFTMLLSEMIEHCAKVKISKDDGMPTQVCSNCIYRLGVAYHFKQQCESADVRLRQYIGLNIEERLKDAETMTDPIKTVVTYITKKKINCKTKMKSSTYKRKPEEQKLKRGPKPKPKKPNECFQCGKDFKCPAQLETHIRTHTGERPFACMYCSRRFTQKFNLTIHMRIHTGVKPFQCEICSKTFSALGNMQSHRKIHLGQRDQICPICNKGFITSSELNRHMNKHTGARNYRCDICGDTFTQKRDVQMHKKKKHMASTSSTSQKLSISPDTVLTHKDPPHPPTTHAHTHTITQYPHTSHTQMQHY